MAWTAATLALIEAAIVTAITEGVASVTIGNHAATTYTLAELRAMRAEIVAEIASSTAGRGLPKFQRLQPYYP